VVIAGGTPALPAVEGEETGRVLACDTRVLTMAGGLVIVARTALGGLDVETGLVIACVECGTSVRLVDRPRVYCGERCKQILKVVHYGRRTAMDGRLEDPLVEDAIRMRIAQIAGVQYPRRRRRGRARRA